jgi:hypothetical protein
LYLGVGTGEAVRDAVVMGVDFDVIVYADTPDAHSAKAYGSPARP